MLRLGLDAAALHGLGNLALTETVLELAGQVLEVFHSAGAVGSSALGLLGPVEASHLSSGVAAGTACRILDVEGTTTAADAQGVGLVDALAEAACALRHFALHGKGTALPSSLLSSHAPWGGRNRQTADW